MLVTYLTLLLPFPPLPPQGAPQAAGSGPSAQAGGIAICADQLVDQATSGCIEASSIPALGSLFPLSLDFNVDGSGNVGIGTATPGAGLHVSKNPGAAGSTLKIEGGFDFTNAYAGIKGTADFDGLASADWAGLEIGLAGIAALGASFDNYGVVGHSNGVGVRGEHSGDPGQDYAELGTSGVGLVASGSTHAARFVAGDVEIVDGNVLLQQSSTAEALTILNTADSVETLSVERTGAIGSNHDVIGMDVPAGTFANVQFLEAVEGIDVKFRVNVNGNVTADGSYTGPADFAEMISVSTGAESVEPGDVLVIDPARPRALVRSARPHSTLVAGVYSTDPGFVGSERDWDRPALPHERSSLLQGEAIALDRGDMATLYDEVPVAIVGIVPCKVSAENGAVRPGDLLVTSSTPGHAMRADDPRPGTIVGKSLGFLGSGTGSIRVLVTLQ